MCTVWPSKLSAAIGRSMVRSFGKDRSSRSSSTTSTPLNNTITISTVPTANPASSSPPITTNGGNIGSGMSGKPDGMARDLVTEARSFTSSLANVFLLKKRDQQSKHLLEKAQFLIDALLAENQKIACKSGSSTTPRQTARSASSMGQLWVKLDELKRENDDLRRQRGKSQDDWSASPKDKGPGEVIINDLQKTKTDNEALKIQVTQLQKSVRELQAVNANLQDEYKRSKAALDAAQRSVEKYRSDYKKMETSLAASKTENESLKQKLTAANCTKPMSLRTDRRLTENINERCRPSTIALRYNSLESQQWVDAKEAVEDGPGSHLEESNIVSMLCQGLMSTYKASRQLYANVELVISELLRQPTLATAVLQSPLLLTSCPVNNLSDDHSDLVRQALRQTTDTLDTDTLISTAADNQDPDTRSALQTMSSIKAVHNYLKECAGITWQMTVQNPPMELAANDSTFDDTKHKLWWSCDQSQANKVDMFVWPVLYDYQNGNVLVKGCVCAS